MADRKALIGLIEDEAEEASHNLIRARMIDLQTLLDIVELLKEQETMMQCIKGKCRICPHCANCDVDENGLLKEQQPKTGHWKRTGRKNAYGGIEIVCSVCDDHVTVQNVDDELFCRHCGAKMGKEFGWDKFPDTIC